MLTLVMRTFYHRICLKILLTNYDNQIANRNWHKLFWNITLSLHRPQHVSDARPS
jgi:hypothetical protein